jgi:hypothetical protein
MPTPSLDGYCYALPVWPRLPPLKGRRLSPDGRRGKVESIVLLEDSGIRSKIDERSLRNAQQAQSTHRSDRRVRLALYHRHNFGGSPRAKKTAKNSARAPSDLKYCEPGNKPQRFGPEGQNTAPEIAPSAPIWIRGAEDRTVDFIDSSILELAPQFRSHNGTRRGAWVAVNHRTLKKSKDFIWRGGLRR